MWKVEVSLHAPYGFRYRIFRDDVAVGEGLRQSEFDAKQAGYTDMNMARVFNVGAPAYAG